MMKVAEHPEHTGVQYSRHEGFPRARFGHVTESINVDESDDDKALDDRSLTLLLQSQVHEATDERPIVKSP